MPLYRCPSYSLKSLYETAGSLFGSFVDNFAELDCAAIVTPRVACTAVQTRGRRMPVNQMDVRLLPRSLSGYIAGVDLETAVAALAPRLVAYATGRTGCRSTAEDIAQDALVALVLRWRRFGPPESPDAFVFAIARRRA